MSDFTKGQIVKYGDISQIRREEAAAKYKEMANEKPKNFLPSLFVRNLSPQVTEGVIREVFGACDDIEKVTFRSFPNSNNQFFAQIDFRTSKGVTEGNKLSGVNLMGVACECTVIDPVRQMANQKQKDAELMELLDPSRLLAGVDDADIIQAESIRRQREAEDDQRFRTVHVAGLPKTTTEEALKRLVSKFGEVEALRISNDRWGNPFGLVEFKERGPAHVCKKQQMFTVDDVPWTFTQAKTFVDSASFAEKTVHFQEKTYDPSCVRALMGEKAGDIDSKLLAVRAAAESILKGGQGDDAEAEAQAEEEKKKRKKAKAAKKKAKKVKKEREKKEKKEKKAKKLKKEAKKIKKAKKKAKKKKKAKRKGNQKRAEAEASGSESGAAKKSKRKAKAAGGEGEDASIGGSTSSGSSEAISIAGEDEVALVPNTETVVLGMSSSSSSSSSSEATGARSGAGGSSSSDLDCLGVEGADLDAEDSDSSGLEELGEPAEDLEEDSAALVEPVEDLEDMVEAVEFEDLSKSRGRARRRFAGAVNACVDLDVGRQKPKVDPRTRRRRGLGAEVREAVLV